MNEYPRFLKNMLATPPKHGEGVHSWLFCVSRHLHAHLCKEDIFALLKASLVDCGREVPDREIRDAIENSEASAWRPGVEKNGDWKEPAKKRPEFNKARWQEVVSANASSVADLMEESPVRFDPPQPVSEIILPQLFPDNPLVCVGWSIYEAITKPLSEFTGELAMLQFVVPNPMSKPIGKNKKGKDSARCLDNVGPRVYLVVEMDRGTPDEQASVLKHLMQRYPHLALVLVVHSGGKSLHCWFQVRGLAEAELEAFLRYCAQLGADLQMLCLCQFARMPGGLRDNGKRQEVLYWNPNNLFCKSDARPVELHGPNGDSPPTDEAAIYQEIDLENFVDEEEEPVPEFPLDTLPERFLKPVREVMRHYRVNALLPATCALLINSAALGRGVVAKSNVRRTYANLYAIIGAKSGTGKSPVFDEFMAPLEELQRASLKEFDGEQKPRAQAELKLLERQIQQLTRQGTNPLKFSDAEDCRHERLAEMLQQKAELEDKLQYASRLWTVDFTSEALGMLLAASNEQIAVLTDEGGLVIHNLLGRYTDGDVKDDVMLCKAKTVNGTAVDRVGRPPIVLNRPCVTMLVLTQPDLLDRLFSNARLLIGGFLARCLVADSKMEIQYEDEDSLPEVDPEVMAAWKEHIASLVKAFRFAEQPYQIPVDDEVRKLSRDYSNEIVGQVRGSLGDVDSFAVRWCEQAWGIALNLHIGHFGAPWLDNPVPLGPETFSAATRISRFFSDRQLEVLQRPRLEAQQKQRTRLQEVLEANQKNPMTIRTLRDRHGLKKEEVISCVKSHPELFGMLTVDPPHGGSKSTQVFLRSNPPTGLKGAK